MKAGRRIYSSVNLVVIVLSNTLPHIRRQANTWNDTDIRSVERRKFSEIWNTIPISALKKAFGNVVCKISAILVRFQSVSFSSLENELVNLRTLQFSALCKNLIFHCMGKIFYVEFQRCPLDVWVRYFVWNFKVLFEMLLKISYPYIEWCVIFREVEI